MAHGYQTLQQWNKWLAQQFLGASILEEECKALTPLLKEHYGKHALLIGVPNQARLLESTTLSAHTLMSPFFKTAEQANSIESDLHELPVLTGSVDLVILPHTLEFVDNPRQLLSEACRIIKPEGLMVICGFNPYSTWGLRKLFANGQAMPWSSNFIESKKVRSWLQLADFKMEQQKATLFRPPFNYPKLYQKLHFIEHMGKCVPLLGGVYILLARAKVVPLTPIKMKWKQQLSHIKIPTTVPRHTYRRVLDTAK